MDKELNTSIVQFISKHIDPSKPVLMGLSGGPDSVALFHLLRVHLSLLHVVHIDHGWREESKYEAQEIEKLASSFGLPYHTTRLNPHTYCGNLEDCSRQERLQFFLTVCKKVAAQGIFLGHHAGDQAETVLKRVLEGSSLPSLRGMQEVSSFNGLSIFRPLLGIPKQSLVTWLQLQGYSYFTDPTNKDTRFLRASLRTHVFPFLKEHFHKECEKSLWRLGQAAAALDDFLQLRALALLEQGIRSSQGLFFEFQKFPHSVEWDILLRNLAKLYTVSLSHAQIACIISLLEKGVANKCVEAGHIRFFIDRKRLFVVEKEIFSPPTSLKLSQGTHMWGPWKVIVEEKSTDLPLRNHWKDVWKGELSTRLDCTRDYFLEAKLKPSLVKEGQGPLGKWLNDNKVPHFLAQKCPGVARDCVVYEDFLTGYSPPVREGGSLFVKLERIN